MDRIKTSVLVMMLILVTTIFPFEYVRYTTADGLADNHVRDVAITDDGTVWIASAFGVTFAGGLTRWDNNGFTCYYPWNTGRGLLDDCVLQVELDDEGNLWVSSGFSLGHSMGGLSMFDGLTWATYTTDYIYGGGFNPIYALRFDYNGNLLLGGGGFNALYILDMDSLEFSPLHVEDDLPEFFTVLDIVVASDSSIWIPSWIGDGVLRIKDTVKTQFTTEDGLIEDSIVSVEEDSSGNIWVGFDHGGVMFYDGSDWINAFEGVIHDSTLWNSWIMIDEYNRKWVGDIGRIFCISDTGYIELTFLESMRQLEPNILVDDKLYVAAPSVYPGLYVIDVSTIDWDWMPLPPYSVAETRDIPEKIEIEAYPNPFNGSCNISADEPSQFTIYDIQGKKIETLEGREVSWKPEDDIVSGVYFLKADAGNKESCQKLIYLK